VSTTGPLRIIPLGGLGEVGKNMMAIECGDDIVVVDAGVLFPQEDMLGVDLVIPDTTYLQERISRVRAILITHGHEDHVGALPYVLRDVNVPVYAPPLARALIHVKLQEHWALRDHQLHEVQPGDRIPLGDITAEFFQVCHSIPDACGIALHTPMGVVVHTGDFKIDHTPVDGRKLDMQRLADLGREGVLLLLSDSTYAEMPGYTPSEQVVGAALDHVIGDAPGRVLVTTFASLIARVQQVITAAVRHDRKVAVVGRSMVDNVRMAMENGYIKAPSNTVVDLKELKALPPERQVIMTTGSQGEPTSVLVRIANRSHREIAVQPQDTFIISASTIPGNETKMTRTIDNLYRQGARVLHARTAPVPVHVHGHASQEELKTMLNLVRPHYFVPIHGEFRMLVAHAELAKAVGVEPENVFVLEDGDVLELGDDSAGVVEHIDAGHIFVDGLRLWDTRSVVLRDRRALARDGFVVVMVRLDHSSNRVVGKPDVVSGGFVDMDEDAELVAGAIELVHRELDQAASQPLEWNSISTKVREVLRSYLHKQTGRRPMVILVPVEV
jgi:ribonuclease J